ncbi:hypothetical protein KIN20_021839 [Parelaphostrongylus tenuis]|uniref:Serine-threonine/tyrosine-protein kinase catalytic domain-containing protein n=1 Tax=Parelaphostrongylus tenuis TaxID=148309 RepID=A0AAD5MPD2_PARTN|nr:hypothetical protein KIN20_021839 [Parelaphostrongylus tenuis]
MYLGGVVVARLSGMDETPVDQNPPEHSKREIILSVVCEGETDKRRNTPAMLNYEQQEEKRLGIKKYARVRGKAGFMLKYPIPPQSWEYFHTDIHLGRILGEGAYGMVRAGRLQLKSGKTIEVAIKQSKCHSEMGKAKIKEMMNEARLMRLFKVEGSGHSLGCLSSSCMAPRCAAPPQ